MLRLITALCLLAPLTAAAEDFYVGPPGYAGPPNYQYRYCPHPAYQPPVYWQFIRPQYSYLPQPYRYPPVPIYRQPITVVPALPGIYRSDLSPTGWVQQRSYWPGW